MIDTFATDVNLDGKDVKLSKSAVVLSDVQNKMMREYEPIFQPVIEIQKLK